MRGLSEDGRNTIEWLARHLMDSQYNSISEAGHMLSYALEAAEPLSPPAGTPPTGQAPNETQNAAEGWACSHRPRCADAVCSDNPDMQRWLRGESVSPRRLWEDDKAVDRACRARYPDWAAWVEAAKVAERMWMRAAIRAAEEGE